MFTGIIEKIGTIKNIVAEGENVHFTVESELAPHLQIDQSVAHNGVCLTVVELTETTYTVTAILETLQKANLRNWKTGTKVNLELAMKANARLDGHFVQGHVDTVGTCTEIKEADGSWYFGFDFPEGKTHLVVQKGSICVNGVSLTVVDASKTSFSVAIIPYTYQHTNFHQLEVGDLVNLEFDIVGKYIAEMFFRYQGKN